MFIYYFFLVDRPKTLNDPVSDTKIENERAVFTCSWEGNPLPDIVWFRNDTKLSIVVPEMKVSKSGTVTNVTSTLTIDNLNRTDGGMYKCVANNTVKSNVSSNVAELTVYCKYMYLIFNYCIWLHNCQGFRASFLCFD